MLYQKKPIFKIELSHKIPLLQKKEYSSIKMLNSKNALSQKYPQPQKEPCGIQQKKIPKKIFPKKIQKKIEERLPRFSRSQIGGGGEGTYTDTMVVACLYGYNRHGDRHKDMGGMEIWR